MILDITYALNQIRYAMEAYRHEADYTGNCALMRAADALERAVKENDEKESVPSQTSTKSCSLAG